MKKEQYGSTSNKSIPEADGLLEQKQSGTMDYTQKQEKFEKEDKTKLKRNGFKDSRY